MSKPFMIFNIEIDRTLISEMQDAQPRVSVIPFTGYVRSDLFTGTILPGRQMYRSLTLPAAAICRRDICSGAGTARIIPVICMLIIRDISVRKTIKKPISMPARGFLQTVRFSRNIYPALFSVLKYTEQIQV